MSSPVLTVSLNPAVDKMAQLDRLRWGEEERIRRITFCAGGKGINVSRALQKFGVKTIAMGFIGGHSGEFLKRELKKENIPFSGVVIKGESRTNLTLLNTRNQLLVRVLEPGPRIFPGEAQELSNRFQMLIRRAGYVVLSGQLPQGLKNNFYSALIRVAQQQGKKVVLDTRGAPLAIGLKAKPFMVKPNKEETEFIVGYKLNSLRRVKQAAAELLRRGAGQVFITLGAQGAFATDGKSFLYAQSPRQKKNPLCVGCGDAFIAGFLYGQMKAFPFPESFAVAVAAGTVNVGALRPGDISKNSVVKLAQKIYLRKIF